MSRRAHFAGLGLGAALLAFAFAGAHPRDLVLYNHSPSLPVGFYQRSAASPALGSIVTIRAHDAAPQIAAARHFDGPGNRFIKRVAATSGDVVCAIGPTITINGEPVAERRERSSSGAALPRWTGCRTLGASQLFLLGDTENSFDGRYWGPIEAAQIEGVWRPL